MVAIQDVPDFATPAELEEYTKGAILSNDPRALGAIAAVTQSIRREAGWHIGPAVVGHSVTLDGPGGPTLSLPTQKLTELVSVTELGVSLDVDELDWSELGLVQRVNCGSWTRRYRKIVVVMDHGYDELAQIKFLTLSLVARGLASPMGATREQAGAMSINWATVQQGVSGGLVPLDYEREIINSYKLVAP
ncbi:head-to-tail adaptor [Arthrobacter phage Suppi]|uniref:Head-to-tail adaptor n=5 Tax=Korravirus TaxID=1982076 RepID=A0A1D8ESJ6_9CAUD|nr:head-tail adaptor [Arthrobacter phage Wayne]YP_010050180.1 head-tail adaptor [Arthrobacter phage Litotes]AOT24039.1 head-to-tail adaptor [Arthrobacter phage Suppi]ASR83247.1 head-to-tail adaptor [Arthrobacter phage Canowicakte]AZF97647.1 head-to-tail adaptor [Arthrobacter phage CallieOMalley]QHB47181.1 head-to-tail adaptor [Arthrobacter phage AppleCider]ALY10736.1 head-to-tail adaptor [Arthrobacter phage Wayne]